MNWIYYTKLWHQHLHYRNFLRLWPVITFFFSSFSYAMGIILATISITVSPTMSICAASALLAPYKPDRSRNQINGLLFTNLGPCMEAGARCASKFAMTTAFHFFFDLENASFQLLETAILLPKLHIFYYRISSLKKYKFTNVTSINNNM